MDEAIRNAAVFGALALAAGSFGWWPRWGWLGSVLVAVGGLITAVVLGVLDPAAPALWAASWPAEPLLLLAGWATLGLGLRRLGGVGGIGPSLLGAFMGGAAFGALPVALGLAHGRAPRPEARLTLAAVAGGLCGPLGSAPILLLVEPGVLPLLWPLGLGLGLLAALPLRGSTSEAGTSDLAQRVLLVAALPLWLLGLFGSPAAALGVGLVLVWGLVAWRRPSATPWPGWRGAVRVLGSLICVLLLVPAGVLDLLTWGLDDARMLLGSLLDTGFGLGSWLAAGLLGGGPVGLAGALAACSDPGAYPPQLRAALIAGASVGAMLPTLRWAGPGVLRAGLGRWAAAVGLLLAWLAWVAL
jgi:hypothetical protein